MTSTGALYAVLAYTWWGLSPLYWRALQHVPPVWIMAHRVVWAALFFALLLWWRGRLREVPGALRRRSVLVLATTGLLLATNWFVYLLAVTTDRVLDASLGYFINPLLNVVLGLLLLGERLRRWQWVAVLLAMAGVANMAADAHHFPWISLVLAGSFGLYGLLRKTAPQDALLGSSLETVFMMPLAFPILLWPALFGATPPTDLATPDWILLVATGAQTALPTLWFSNAARRLPLSVLGFFQYLAPSFQFLLAVFVFDEPFDATRLRSFLLIWCALAILSVEMHSHRRRSRRPAPIQS